MIVEFSKAGLGTLADFHLLTEPQIDSLMSAISRSKGRDKAEQYKLILMRNAEPDSAKKAIEEMIYES